MNIEDEKIFTISNCGVEYELPWEYLKRSDFFETLRQENKIPESNVFKLFTSPVAFPYVLSYLINPKTIVPIEYKLDFAYFGIEPEFKNDITLFQNLKNELLYEIREKLFQKNYELLIGIENSLMSLKNSSYQNINYPSINYSNSGYSRNYY